MGAWLRDHMRVAREAAYFTSSRVGTSLLVWLLVGIALALPAGLFLLQVNLEDLSQGWDGRPGLSLYFEVGATDETVNSLAQELRGKSELEAVSVISAQQALTDFQSHSGLNDALALLEENPLPASMRGVLAPKVGLAQVETLAQTLRERPGVQEVVIERTWLERVRDITLILQRLSWLLGILFGLGALLVTSTSVRLAIESRLEELRVQKLVGATDRQIRRPFLYYGLAYGTGGALVALMLISFALLVVEVPLGRLFGSYGEELEFVGFDPIFLLVLLAAGAVLGVSGALLAVRQRVQSLEIL